MYACEITEEKKIYKIVYMCVESLSRTEVGERAQTAAIVEIIKIINVIKTNKRLVEIARFFHIFFFAAILSTRE